MENENQQQVANNQEQGGMSYREFELVQEFAKAKLEAQSELQYEDLSDYEIPPRTQFSMLKKPAVSIKYKELTFNMTCVRMFDGITNVLMSLSGNKRRLAVIMRKEEGAATVEWSRLKDDKYVNKTITSLEFTDAIYRLMSWNRENRYKVLGRVSNSAEGLILVFELDEAIMFDSLPEQYVDKKTGELKKRIKVYYPAKYEGRIGNYYHDYVSTEQMNLFENLNDYTQKENGIENQHTGIDEASQNTLFGSPGFELGGTQHE